MAKLHIDVWSDIACPWCWVGKRHLERALADFPHEVEIRWRSFELDPAAPKSLPDDVDLVERLAGKYGTSRAGAQQMIDRMTNVGRDAGLDFRFGDVRPTNTFDAHRLLHWALSQGKQGALKERLMQAYMHEGRSVSDPAVLVELAEAVGLDPDGAQAVLSSDDHAADVRNDEALARQIGITGVPFFAVAERFAVPGAQPPDVLRQVLDRALADLPETVDEPAQGEVCGPDGCAVDAAVSAE